MGITEIGDHFLTGKFRRDLQFWLSIVTEHAGVGKSRLPGGKTATDKDRMNYVLKQLQTAGAKLMRESIEREQKQPLPSAETAKNDQASMPVSL